MMHFQRKKRAEADKCERSEKKRLKETPVCHVTRWTAVAAPDPSILLPVGYFGGEQPFRILKRPNLHACRFRSLTNCRNKL